MAESGEKRNLILFNNIFFLLNAKGLFHLNKERANIKINLTQCIFELFEKYERQLQHINKDDLLKGLLNSFLSSIKFDGLFAIFHDSRLGKDLNYCFGIDIQNQIFTYNFIEKVKYSLIKSPPLTPIIKSITLSGIKYYILAYSCLLINSQENVFFFFLRKSKHLKKKEKEYCHYFLIRLSSLLKTKKYYDEINELISVSRNLTETNDLNETINMLITSVTNIFKADYVHLLQLISVNKSNDYLQILSSSDPEIPEKYSFPKGLGISGWIINNNKFLLVHNLLNEKKAYEGLTENNEKILLTPVSVKNKENDKCILGVPLRYKGVPTGVILMANTKDSHAYDNEDDKNLLQLFADQATIIIENLKFKKAEEERTKEFLETASLNNPSAIAMSFVHDARHSIGNVNAYISSIVKYIPSETLKQIAIQSLISTLTKESENLSELFKSLVKFARKDELNIENNLIKDIMDHVLYLMSIRLKSIKCSIIPQIENYDTQHIDCDRTEIEQLFINLFNNSIYAINQNTKQQGEIKITIRKINHSLLFEFRDNGIGISENNLPLVFDLFFTTKKDGTGFGLPICKRIVKEHHKGEIYVKSNLGEFTTIFIKLNLTLN